MIKPPESTHERLNRELWRARLRGGLAWIVASPVIILLVWISLPQPRDVSYRLGTVTGVTTLIGEAGPIIRIGIDLDGIRVEAGTRANLLAPANGELVCVSHNVSHWTGAEHFSLTSMRFCDGSIPTPGVE